MLLEFTLSTQDARPSSSPHGERPGPREDFYNITSQVRQAISESGAKDGIAVVFCPHTTAGITINENADPNVVHDMLLGLSKAYPDRPEFRHGEGNSAAHLKATAVGSSVTVIVADGMVNYDTPEEVRLTKLCRSIYDIWRELRAKKIASPSRKGLANYFLI